LKIKRGPVLCRRHNAGSAALARLGNAFCPNPHFLAYGPQRVTGLAATLNVSN
jgi:hypothetical protein